MTKKQFRLLPVFLLFACLPAVVHSKDAAEMAADKAQEAVKPNPPAETPSGTRPADPANPGENTAKPADPGNSGKPDTAAEPGKNANPPDETTSGTKPAEPAKPGEEPATPAEPGKGKPEDKDKPAKEDKPEKTKKGGHSGPGGSAPAVPAAVPAGAAAGAAAILPLGKKDEPEAAEPAVAASTAAPGLALYSSGKGPKIAVLDLEGEGGPEFAALLAKDLAADLMVYNPSVLAGKKIPAAVTRLTAKKTAAELGVEYLVSGKVSKKSASVVIVSVFLRDAASGDVKLSVNRTLRGSDKPSDAALSAAAEIIGKILK